ncbi:stabilizer of axonemal microtubules 2 [Siniperca chuatsi]|uniref:stabilizer of axonemal microtubules 2 n=1 Tax=Siniperca chuatsi TaxID=119488 RepID=UPI001CE09BB6|nr:stabilizer of axonemal microtubules 2 [Siniperca chuatsi]
MHPKPMRQQCTQQNGSQRATSTRKFSSSQRAQTRASMITEYQERFLPPRCHTAVVSTTIQKNPYHPLKGMNSDMTTFRSYYVTHKWIKGPPKAPKPPTPPKGQQRCSSAPHNPVRSEANQMPSKVEDYISVYQNDFRAWKVNKRQPYKLNDSLKINQGLVVSASKEGNSVQAAANSKPDPQVREPRPFESVTSYRSDYVIHPLQPRTRSEKPVYKTNTGLTLEHAAPSKPKVAWDINQELFDETSEFFRQFKTWSLETKFHGQGKAKESSPPADHNNFLSTTHADYTAPKCQRTKPIQPSMQTSEKSKELFQATTTMKDDYKAWDTPQSITTVRNEQQDWPKRTTFPVSTPKPAESCKTNPKPFSLQPKLSETAVCNSSCNATQKPQCPAENGAFFSFECISPGNKESRRYWTTSLDRGVIWPDGDICEEPSEAHQIISCMVSSRN